MSVLGRLNRKFLLRYRLEYVLALVVVYLVRGLSPALAWNGARAVGRFCWWLGWRRSVTITNLGIAFPDMSEEDKGRLGKRVYQHLGAIVVDCIFQRRMLTRQNLFDRVQIGGWMRRYLDAHGEEGLRRRTRRILFLTGHMGNWEMSSGCFSLLGVSIAPVYRIPQNPWLARLLMRIRLDSQARFIERRGAVSRMLKHLETDGNIGFLFDQEALHGPRVPFFGHPASTHRTPAVLARDHGVQIFFGVLVRRGDFLKYEARGELLELSPEMSEHEIMSELSQRLEAEIRQDPEQYLWTHRRWKRVGVHGEDHILPSRRNK